MLEKYIGAIINPVENVSDGLTAVREGKVDLFISDLVTVSHMLKQKGSAGFKVTESTEHKIDYCMAVRRVDAPLGRIVDKSLIAITDQQKKKIFDTWLILEIEKKTDWKTLLKTLKGYRWFLF